MVLTARVSAFLAGLAAIVLAGMLTAPLPAVASAPMTTTAPIGYIYAGSIFGGLDTLAVAPDHSVTVIKNTPSPSGDIMGVALLHTKGGLWLYVESGPFAGQDNIYEYAVNQKTGAIARTKAPPVAALGFLRGNNLFAYDGYGANPAYASVIYAQVCIVQPCSKYGLAGFRANATTGALQKFLSASPAVIDSLSISGDRLAVLQSPASGPGLAVSSYLIVHSTGTLKAVVNGYRLVNNAHEAIGGNDVAAGGVTGIDGLSNNGVAQVGVLSGGAISETPQQYTGSTLAFIPHTLLEGEVGPTSGPFLQLIAPDGRTSAGGIDLTLPPYNLGSGSALDPHFPETIYRLGAGIYIGVYLGPVVQATDGVGGKGLVIDKKPTVAGTVSITSMAGFLKPAATKTTIAVKASGKTLIVSGTVKGGVAGLLVTVTLYVEKGKVFVPVQHKSPALSSTLHYSATLSKPNASVCRAVASYAGNAATAASSARLTFAC